MPWDGIKEIHIPLPRRWPYPRSAVAGAGSGHDFLELWQIVARNAFLRSMHQVQHLDLSLLARSEDKVGFAFESSRS